MTDTITHTAIPIRVYVGGYRRWRAKCGCGWKATPVWTRAQAEAIANTHNRRIA